MTLEDLISMTLEDLMPSHVYIYVCVVSLITKLFSVSLSLFAYLKPLRKRELSYFQSGGHTCATKNS